ncbi:MAG: sigma-70 family RNA polymerase sigma factor [Deltaproteobacteria bacterium]|nr:sigma-70 family RNA polymerase sigma factor [Deltaproteobacteria bacterium]
MTAVLQAWSQESPEAIDQLMPLVLDELRILANSHFRREASNHTLQPTALINELYLRLLKQHSIQLRNRTEFFAFASRLMRRILVDHYRRNQKAKRGGGSVRVTLDEALRITSSKSINMMDLDRALEDLKKLDARQHQIVELRFFGGLTNNETAQVLALSQATVKREWSTARAWLRHRIEN